MTENPESIKEELYRNPAVLRVSNASDLPGERYSLETMTLDSRPDDQGVQLRVAWRSDYDYAAALGLEFVAGRDFSREAPRDTSAWLLNESAVRRLGLDQPVGEILHWGDYSGPIVGVVKDFNFASLRTEIEPLVIPLRPGYGGKLLIRYSGASPSEIVDHVSATLEDLFPGSYYSYAFLDDAINALYQNEETLRDVLGYFTAFAILVACLGLFGLAAFMADARLAEIGVRKVLGATTLSIAVMFVRDFLVLVGLALVLAAPLTWLAAERWLSDFSFRIQLSPMVFLGAGFLAAAVAVLTVGYQATRAAHTDPVVSIRGSN
jgi:putative ABC transport system permease protein